MMVVGWERGVDGEGSEGGEVEGQVTEERVRVKEGGRDETQRSPQ